MRVLLAVVADGPTGSSSVGFAVSMLRLQTALLASKGIDAVVKIQPSIKAAAREARDGYDALVAVSPLVEFPAAFVMRALATPAPFVAGVYPLPRVNWDRVKARASDATEATRFKGNVYNVDAASARPAAEAGYLAVRSAGLGAAVLKGEAIGALAACEAAAPTDEELCAAWGRDILVDLYNQCATTGPLEFSGCVGLRAVLR